MTPISRLIVGLLSLSIIGSAVAQTNYPEKPVRLVVGFPPGSQPDTVARLVGDKLAETWGKAVLIDDVTGAAGNIAADRVAKAAPDGYTLGQLSQTQLVINPSLYKLPYDPAHDFAPVSQLTLSPNILVVHNAVPAASVKELVALAKAQPGSLTFASSGSGSATHMAAELFKSAAGIDLRHIPYKGVVAAMPDLLTGRVAMMFSTIAVALPSVREGKLRALAVTSLRRSAVILDLPTVAESGYPGFEVTNWYAIVAPARTPAAIVSGLHLQIVKALSLPDLRGKLTDLGMEVIGNSPDEFAIAITSEIPKWAKLIKESGTKPD